MWIVRLALTRPYTFIVLAILILIAAPVVILRTPTDILPPLKVPVVVFASYRGMPAPEQTVTPVTQTMRAEIELSNPEAKLRPGMYGTSSLVVEEPTGVGLVLEADDGIICVAKDDHIARRLPLSPAIGPEVKGVVQVDVGKQR